MTKEDAYNMVEKKKLENIIILSGNGHISAERDKRAAVQLHKPEMESFNEAKGRLTKSACG